MELAKVIQIAQSHLDGENVSLDSVLEAFRAFIEESTPLSERTCRIAEKPLPYFWAEVEERNLLVSDEEALKFFKEFKLTSDGDWIAIDEIFDRKLEHRFEDVPKGSIFAEAIQNNNVEKVEAMIDHGTIYLEERYNYGDYTGLPIEIAAKFNHKEIVEILLSSGAIVSETLIQDTTNPEIKKY